MKRTVLSKLLNNNALVSWSLIRPLLMEHKKNLQLGGDDERIQPNLNFIIYAVYI